MPDDDYTEVCECCGNEYQPWELDNGYCKPCSDKELDEL